ncbi:MAG: DEAD/DEAH box helicase, partial [Actinomycetaceae bacterium]
RTVSVAMRIAEEYGPGADGPIPAEDEVAPATEVDLSGLRRTPYPHQREGIEWMAGLMDASLRSPSNDPSRVQGAILADDMGLGKTFMALVAMRHCARADAARNGTARPHLAVLPVALIDNWETELAEAFDVSPFTEVVVLQGDRDLRRFRTGHRGRETLVREDQVDEFGEVSTKDIRLSLMVGEAFGEDRVDMPGRLVLTTYDTLRSNQLSLGQVDWGVVAFDEAQNLKNPDSLGARAAKGLKAGFKLLATGTPVENSLRDFWSLMDTAQPGHLGSWQDFKAEWVDRIAGAEPEEREAAGVELRDHVGRFMLRRVKEDHLTDLPTKTVHTPFGEPGPGIQVDPGLAVTMPTGQAAAYDKSLASFQGRRTKAGALDVLGQIRAVSLHPEARGSSPIDTDPRGIEDSARISATVRILDQVRDAGEKAIVFVGTKRVQRAMSGWLRDRYGIPVPVVNGDTKATGSGDSRRAIIQRFEAREGFNVIIMAPRAVGVGLTIVGANHAIHLEREWNPAKEAQATDRIYRIGQKRPVHVYLPMAEHPRVESFDRNLDRLLRNKTALKDTILVPEAVDEDALASSLGLVDPTP